MTTPDKSTTVDSPVSGIPDGQADLMVELGGADRLPGEFADAMIAGQDQIEHVLVPARWLQEAGWAPADEVERLRKALAQKQAAIDEVAEQFYVEDVDVAAIAGLLALEASDSHTVQLIVFSTPVPDGLAEEPQ